MCRPDLRIPPGFTLIELLLTITIVAILAALLIGPASRVLKKARDADWANKVEQQIEELVVNLKRYYGSNDVREAPTPQRLAELNIIDGALLQFLNDPRVRFKPFVSADPDETLILHVNIAGSFLNGSGHVRTVRKHEISDDQKFE